MLRSFRVANHKSIRDEQELVLLPAYDKSRPVVPVAAIFGANASGKSNLLDSMAWLKSAVLDSYGRWQPGSGVPRRRFALELESGGRPTSFDVDVVMDGVRYVYRLTVNSRAVVEEHLTSYPNGRPRAIFRRKDDELVFGSTVPEARSLTNVLSRLTRDNALLLSVAAANDVEEVQQPYQWFQADCAVATAPYTVVAEDDLARQLTGSAGAILDGLIKAADLGIKDIEVSPKPSIDVLAVGKANEADHLAVTAVVGGRRYELVASDEDGVKSLLHWLSEDASSGRVVFRHGRGEATLGLLDESAGTQSWINLVVHALDVIQRGGVLLVDEVDASLHPHLTARLVNLFRDEETNPKLAQLIFTTHDATLLDDEVLSRDEVWFMEKDSESGASRLYPLTDFHPRKNENTEGRYLAGSYGAVPRLADHRFRAALRRGKRSDAA